jgi:PQQ-dependent catabolism-associated CXXCW motif protein
MSLFPISLVIPDFDVEPGELPVKGIISHLNGDGMYLIRRFVRTLALWVVWTMILMAGSRAYAQGLADEDRDWQVQPPEVLRQAPYSAPTPLRIPGGKVVRTADLLLMTQTSPPPVLIDVAAGEGHETLPGAVWIPGTGRGDNFIDTIQAELNVLLSGLTGGNRDRALVFFCVNSQCWLSFNAARRAIAAGYRDVYWYRGGYAAWKAAGLPLVPIQAVR